MTRNEIKSELGRITIESLERCPVCLFCRGPIVPVMPHDVLACRTAWFAIEAAQ